MPLPSRHRRVPIAVACAAALLVPAAAQAQDVPTIRDPEEGQIIPNDIIEPFVSMPDGTAFECEVDGRRPSREPCAEFEHLPDGAHELRVRYTDAGGQEQVLVRHFFTDTGLPVVTFRSPAADAYVDSTVDVRFDVSDAGSGVDLARVACRVDQGAKGVPVPFTPCDPATGLHLTGLAEGQHNVEVQLFDKAGKGSGGQLHFFVRAGGGPAPRRAKVTARWHATRKSTTVRSLRVSGLDAGASVKLSCRGKGCPAKPATLHPAGATADLTRLLRGRRLRAGAVVRVTVSTPGAASQTTTFRIRRGRLPGRG